jgi:hypothetical protein
MIKYLKNLLKRFNNGLDLCKEENNCYLKFNKENKQLKEFKYISNIGLSID